MSTAPAAGHTNADSSPAAPSPLPILRLRRAGDWSPAQVATAWVPSTLDVPPAARQVIDDAWERATLEPNRKLFDGPMCRMESWAFAGDRVRVGVSRTSYKQFWGTNLMHPELADRFSPAVLANPIGVSPALETADGFLLLGRRNREVAYYPSRVHPFAGGLDPDDVGVAVGSPTGGGGGGSTAVGGPAPDLFAAVRRELAEELHLTDADVELARLTGLAEDVRLRQPELIFRVKSRLGRDRIESQLDAAEHLGMVVIPAEPAAVRQAVGQNELTPVAVAALLLWGRIAFGGEWFAAAARGANVQVEEGAVGT